MCSEWKDFDSFRLWAMQAGFKFGLWIDRIDNDKGYEPANCRWVTPAESARNTRSVKLSPKDVLSIRLAYKRGTKSTELAKKYGVSERHIRHVALGTRWQGFSMVAEK